LHATRLNERTLRFGIWLSALRVIVAYPLFGVGLGANAYRTRAESYRVPPQATPEAHPHTAFLELATMDGIQTPPHIIARLLQSQQRAPRRERALTNEP